MQERISVPQVAPPAEDDNRQMFATVDAQMQATLALSRATLCALAALSPMLSSVTDAALEDEADALASQGVSTSQRALDIVEGIRAKLQRTPAEARAALVLERALLEAAGALQDSENLVGPKAGQPRD